MNSVASTVRSLIILMKPGIIFGNLLIAVASFLYASQGSVDFSALLFFVIGTVAIIGASCVINNYMDTDLDANMARTANRPSVTNAISPYGAYLFAAVLLVVGMQSLLLFVNERTAALGLLGALLYVLVYTPLKRRSYLATAVGTIPGAIPVLAGFMAGQGYIGTEGWVVFGLMLCWQMPHFYAIAVFRHTEYQAAKIPTLSVTKGLQRAIVEIRFYIALFVALVGLLAVYEVLHIASIVVLLGLGIYWLKTALLPATKSVPWARSVFKTSLLVLPTLALVLSVDSMVR
ncbi:MAG: heme o synthase [Candidatus Saccharimonadales bacterium]